ncbi:hypothetical protein JIG36_28865 [Actinoplanes sp. LDG1-06]|uniref:AB hydrolase-1 domain-containing protein n=1 Tax=Paractinoplanes ovalisporus TaxID=2810368 RepID=A0ABS2AI95_9ACTN|nr:alpha/beta fold hydrolase [Actinoplanes ovalisporus]MBM2619562.1 hypothetical protein [Actinoplanes ovalisporus]
MATFVLIHGAGDVGWYWHLVEAELRARGHDTVAPDLPCADDTAALFYQDVPPAPAAEALAHGVDQSEARLGDPSPLRAWPGIPTRVVLGRDDRLLPPGYIRRVARERLGVTPDEIDSGHTPALSRPRELASLLDSYRPR